jgi:hypothetical protein
VGGDFALAIACSAALAAMTAGLGGCRFTGTRGLDPGGDGDAGMTLAGLSALRVEPASAAVTIQAGAPATQAFKAIGSFVDGHEEDVTDRVLWSSSDDLLAQVSEASSSGAHPGPGGVATTGTDAGGRVAITARGGAVSVQGFATLTIQLQLSAVATGGTPAVPPAAAAKFGGAADASRAPQLVYPNDGVLLPPNLGGIEVHFRPGPAANTLFEVAFTNQFADVRAYTRCVPLGGGCLYQVPADVWSHLAASNRGRDPATLTVRATDDAGSGVGTSAAFKVSWSRDDLRGALYYWTTTNPVGILRWNFGDAHQTTAQKVVDPSAGNGKCIGCHALSHDGRRMVMTSGAADVGKLLLFDPLKKVALQPFPLPGQSWFESWNPDGSAFVGVNGAAGFKDLLLFDGATGRQTGSIALGGAQADHPDWSLDGNLILYTDVGEPHDDQTPGRGAIAMVRRAGAAGWSAPVVLAPRQSGRNRYYPAVAPDNQTVVFDQSTCPAGSNYGDLCNADVDPSARLWALSVPAASQAGAAAAPIELARANKGGVTDGTTTDLTTTYPKWSPFAFMLAEDDTLFWVSFSSTRRYGLRPSPPAGDHGLSSGLLIWLAGVEPRQLQLAGDPSFPAFCLPFQDLTTSNHIAQWTSDVPPIVP